MFLVLRFPSLLNLSYFRSAAHLCGGEKGLPTSSASKSDSSKPDVSCYEILVNYRGTIMSENLESNQTWWHYPQPKYADR